MGEKEEYYFLTEKLERVNWALEGQCDDIDCDKYIYLDCLKASHKPILEHNFSCMSKLKVEKDVILRLLSQRKYGRYRFEKCIVCKRSLDKLSNKSVIVSFTKPIKHNGKTCYQWKGVWTHRKCSSKVKIPKGWKKY